MTHAHCMRHTWNLQFSIQNLPRKQFRSNLTKRKSSTLINCNEWKHGQHACESVARIYISDHRIPLAQRVPGTPLLVLKLYLNQLNWIKRPVISKCLVVDPNEIPVSSNKRRIFLHKLTQYISNIEYKPKPAQFEKNKTPRPNAKRILIKIRITTTLPTDTQIYENRRPTPPSCPTDSFYRRMAINYEPIKTAKHQSGWKYIDRS